MLPGRLPPENVLQDRRLWAALERATYEVGRLRDMEARLPAPEFLAVFPAIREAHASAGVEGTTTTFAQALGFEEPPDNEQARLDFRGIQDHLVAQALAIDHARNRTPRHEAMRAVHACLVRSEPPERVEPGKWRSQQVIVPGEHPGVQHARHVPPPATELEGLLADYFRFLDQDEEFPILIRLAMTHAQFELIHPFADGNGRMGRMAILQELIRSSTIESPMLFLSDYFRLFRNEYFEHLTRVGRSSLWDPWIAFFLVGVAEVAIAARAVAETVIGLKARLETEHPAAVYGEAKTRLFGQLFRTPRVTVKSASEATGIGIAAINTAVNRFVDVGWLRQVTPGRRNRAFVFQPYWDALENAGVLDQPRIRDELARLGALPGGLT